MAIGIATFGDRAGCEHSYLLQEWDRAHPKEASTCGMLQSVIVADIKMQVRKQARQAFQPGT